MDVLEIDGASNNSVNDVRHFLRNPEDIRFILLMKYTCFHQVHLTPC
jgi:hypothetical protein